MFDIYKEQFDSSSVWDDSTILLYICVCLITFVISSLSQRSLEKTPKKRQYVLLLIFIFGLLFIISAFRGALVGADTEEYRRIFETSSYYSKSFGYNPTLEKGFVLLNQILSLLINDGRFGISLLSFIFLFFVFKSIIHHRNCINIYIALTSFVFLFYFQSLNLVRIYLASSIMMYALPLLENNKFFKYLTVIAISATIHTSSLILLIPTITLIFYKKSPSLTLIVLSILSIAVLYLGVSLSAYINISRYMDYIDENESGSIGLLAVFEYLPIIYLLFLLYKKKLRGGIYDIFIIFSLVSLLVRLLSYNIIVLGRLPIHFMSLFVIVTPIVINKIRQFDRKRGKLILIFYTIYLFVRLHIYFATMLEPDGLMPYYTILSE